MILVIEDGPDIIMYLDTLLEDNGYKVFQARSAKKGLSVMEQVGPDLICLDIMMPKHPGIAFYRDFKLDDRFKDITRGRLSLKLILKLAWKSRFRPQGCSRSSRRLSRRRFHA